MDRMDELILASLQELSVPPGNANYGGGTNGPTVKRPYQKHMADASRKGICQVLGCDQPLGTAYAKVKLMLVQQDGNFQADFQNPLREYPAKISHYLSLQKYRVCNVHVKSAEVYIHDDMQRFCQKARPQC